MTRGSPCTRQTSPLIRASANVGFWSGDGGGMSCAECGERLEEAWAGIVHKEEEEAEAIAAIIAMCGADGLPGCGRDTEGL